MRPPEDLRIQAPPFPRDCPWIGVPMLRMDQQRGRPVLVEFWDFCRPNSLRTLPYLVAWHERYAEDGLRVVGVHAAGFRPSQDPDAVRAAVERLGIPYPVVVDHHLEISELYGVRGWPSRYVWDREGLLADAHFGEGAYLETELLVQDLLGVDREPLEPLRPEDEPGVELVPQTPDVEGPHAGPYEAGGVWVVVEGSGELLVDGEPVAVEHPGALAVREHARSTRGEIRIEPGEGVTVHATCFTPGRAS